MSESFDPDIHIDMAIEWLSCGINPEIDNGLRLVDILEEVKGYKSSLNTLQDYLETINFDTAAYKAWRNK